jgi:hypothetical protein
MASSDRTAKMTSRQLVMPAVPMTLVSNKRSEQYAYQQPFR